MTSPIRKIAEGHERKARHDWWQVRISGAAAVVFLFSTVQHLLHAETLSGIVKLVIAGLFAGSAYTSYRLAKNAEELARLYHKLADQGRIP